MNLQTLSLLTILLGLSLPATGGVVLRQVRVTESSDAEASGRQVSQIWVEGEKMKIVFEESSNPIMPAGSYLVVPGGDISYLVNPARRTITRMGMARMIALGEKGQPVAEQQAETAGQYEIVDAKLEQTLDETGPQMLGFPTRHYRYELSYTERQYRRGMPGPVNTAVREQHEFWATAALQDDPAIQAYLANQLATPDGEDPRREVEELAVRLHAHGLFLKHVLARKTSRAVSGVAEEMPAMPGMSDAGAERVSREVIELRRATLMPADFELPKGYAETEFLAPAADDLSDSNVPPGQAGPGAPDPHGEPDGGAKAGDAGTPVPGRMPRGGDVLE